MPVRIVDREINILRGKEIVLVKVVWLGASRESMTWELESKMRDSILSCLIKVNFRGRKYSKWRRVVTPVI